MGKFAFIDLVGHRFGYLVAVEIAGKRGNGAIVWNCECDCGKAHTVRGSDLRRGHSTSCGCMSAKPIAAEVIRLALLGHDATAVTEQLGCSRDTTLKVIRLAKKAGTIPKTIWGTYTKISKECRDGVLSDWASCHYREYEIALRNKLPPKYKIASIIERGRLHGDPRAIGYAERMVKLEAYKKSIAIVPKRAPTLAEEIGIKIGPVVVYYNYQHQTACPRRNVITLSGGLVPVHA